MRPFRRVGILILFFVAMLAFLGFGSTIVDAEEYRITDPQYEEPIYLSRFNTEFYADNPVGSIGSSSDTSVWDDRGTRVQSVCWDNNEVRTIVKGTCDNEDGEDYACLTEYSHKIFIPSCQEPFYYTIYFKAQYSCRYWVVGDGSYPNGYTVLKSYYRLEGYDGSDNLMITSNIRYIANYDNRDGVNQNDIVPTEDCDLDIDLIKPSHWHSCGSAITLSISEGISYIRIKFVTSGSWLYAGLNPDELEGIDIRYSDFNLNYKLFSGLIYSQGDQTVGLDRNYGQDDVVLELKGGSLYNTDYGNIRAYSPYLYYNNVGNGFGYRGLFEINYETIQWTRQDSLVYRAYFRVLYYDSNLNYLGMDENKFVDVDTVNPPYKYIEPLPGINVLNINSQNIYNAKYIRVEVSLYGSYLMSIDGAVMRFFDFKYTLNDQNDKAIEILYYYQSDYSDQEDERTTDFWYSINYYFNEQYSTHLCIFKEPVIDDDVTSTKFTGSGELDVASNDFFFFDGHGSTSSSETSMSLTNGNKIDDDEIGNWGPELEFAYFKACNLLGDDDNCIDQASEWEVHGLYQNHALLGFQGSTDREDEDMLCFKQFFYYMIIGKNTIRNSFFLAFQNEPYRSLWDTSEQYNYDYLWDIDGSLGKDVKGDEYPDDSGYLSDPI